MERTPVKDPRREVVKALVSDLAEEFGKGSVSIAAMLPDSDVSEWVSTGSLLVDKIIGRPGIPVGKMTAIIGHPGTGKTTLAVSILKSVQEQSGVGVFFDTEYTFNPEWAACQGLDLSTLVVCQPETVEDSFERLEKVVHLSKELDRPGPIVVVWDSISSTPTKGDLDPKKAGETRGQIAGHALVVSFQLRRLVRMMSKERVALVVICQIKAKPGIMFGSPEGYLAEKPIKFHSTLILRVSSAKQMKVGEEVVGVRSKIKVAKSKVSPPFKSTEIDIMFDRGIDETGPMLDLAVQLGVVQIASKGWYLYGEEKFRKKQWLEVLSNHPELRTSLEQRMLVGE